MPVRGGDGDPGSEHGAPAQPRCQHGTGTLPRQGGGRNPPARDPCTRGAGEGQRLTGSLRAGARGDGAEAAQLGGGSMGGPGEMGPDPAPDPAGALPYPVVLNGDGPDLRPPSPPQHPPPGPFPPPCPAPTSGCERWGRGGPRQRRRRGAGCSHSFICSVRVSYKQRGGVLGRGGTSNGFVTSKKHGGGAGSALQLSQAGGRRGARRDGAGAWPGSSLLLPPRSPNPRGLILTLPLPGANAGSEGNRGAGGCRGQQGAWLGISTRGGVVGGDVGPRGGPSPDPQGLMGPMPPSIQPQPPTSHTP